MTVADKFKLAYALADYMVPAESCPLYPMQRRAFDDIIKDLGEDNEKGHIRFPTGGGKGTMIGAEIEAMLRAEEKGELDLGDKKVLVLTPRKLLVDDLYDRFTGGMYGHITADVIGRRHSNLKHRENIEALEKPILVTTYDTFNALVATGKIRPNEYAIAMLDEAHRTSGPTIFKNIQHYLSDTIVQAWTATDTYADREHVGYKLFGRTTPIHKTDFKTAVNGIKTPPGEDDIAPILCPMVNNIIRTYIKARVKSGKGQDYTRADLSELMVEARDKMAAEMLAERVEHLIDREGKPLTIPFRDQNSIFYCVDIDHAERMADRLNARFGCPKQRGEYVKGKEYALAVSGKTSKKELKEIMARYEDPEDPLKAITNAELLIEGWNSPRCSLCFMLRPTKSPIIAEQTGGRVMRIDPDNPNKVAYILTFWDDIPGQVAFGHVAGAFELGMEERRPPSTREPRRERGEKPVWMTRDPDLRGMNIITDEETLTEFLSGMSHQEADGEGAEEAEEPGLMPESGWVPWATLRHRLILEFGARALENTRPAEDFMRDIERKANTRLRSRAFGEAEVDIDEVNFHVGRFREQAGGTGPTRSGLAMDEEDVETVRAMVEARLEPNDRARLAARRAREEEWEIEMALRETAMEEEWIRWPDLLPYILGPFYPSSQSGALNDELERILGEAADRWGSDGQDEFELTIGDYTLHIQRISVEGVSRSTFAINSEDIDSLEVIIGEQAGIWPEGHQREDDSPPPEPDEPDEEPETAGDERADEWVVWRELTHELGRVYGLPPSYSLPRSINIILRDILMDVSTELKHAKEGDVLIPIDEGNTISIRRTPVKTGGPHSIRRGDIGRLKDFIDAKREQDQRRGGHD